MSSFSITGLGCISAAGANIEATVGSLLHGEPTSSIDPEEKQFLRLKIDPSWCSRFDIASDTLPVNLFAALATEEALTDAGLGRRESRRDLRIGVCLGSTVGGTNFQREFSESYYAGAKPDGQTLLSCFHTNTSQFIARLFGCRGPTLLLNNACTSGADSVGTAARWLAADLCDVAICGGAETILQKIYYGFRSLLLCSSNPCRPFDLHRDGLNLGEGAGILILEKRDTPRKTKAWLSGYGCASDALHPTAPDPEARGLSLAATLAMREAGIDFSKIDFINAHGTATPHNDLSEGRWIHRHAPEARVVATKGFTGHTLGAAGGIEAVFTVLSLLHQQLPASKGFHEPDPQTGVIPTRAIETGPFENALSLSLGFGGTNSALSFRRAP